jgi:Rieske Fe-S protein
MENQNDTSPQSAAMTVISIGLINTANAAPFDDDDGGKKPKITKVPIGKPADYKPGGKKTFAGSGFEVERRGDKFVAISLICTHKGVTLDPAATGFVCPAHGAKFDANGKHLSGPGKADLAWYEISLLPSGELQVDTQKTVAAGTLFATKKPA